MSQNHSSHCQEQNAAHGARPVSCNRPQACACVPGTHQGVVRLPVPLSELTAASDSKLNKKWDRVDRLTL